MSDIVGHNEKLTEVSCNNCIHYHFDNMEGFSCAAFVSIPRDILRGRVKHIKPLSDQGNNISFEQIKD